MTVADHHTTMVEMLDDHQPMPLISEYIQGRRILPLNSPFPGYWDNAKTPYLVPIMDTMSPYSPIRHCVVMAAAQVGKTAGAIEAPLAYYMDEAPTTVMLISATDDLLQLWSENRLEALIDSCGFRHKIAAQVENPKSRKSGDKTFSKQFFGGDLSLVSAQSPGGQRSQSRQVMFRDEIDGAPPKLKTGEGNWLKVSEARIRAYGARGKLMDVSTPTTIDESNIFPMYESGDCNHLWVPCPHCREYQELIDPLTVPEEAEFGLKAYYDEEGDLTDVVYVCRHCKAEIEEHHKIGMLARFQWRPTKKSSSPDLKTFWLPAMYSPFGMYSWKTLWKDLEVARRDNEMQGYVNTVQGLPYRETGTRPDAADWRKHLGNYARETIPEGVLYTTLAVDVQRGSETDVRNPARVEWQVIGHGAHYKTWSIARGSFRGGVEDAYNGAWEDLYQHRAAGGFAYKRLSDGRSFAPVLALVDSGYNAKVSVYQFCDRWMGWAYPSKGASEKESGQEGDPELPGAANSKQYSERRLSGDQTLFLISTHLYKAYVYNRLKIPRREYPQQSGFPDYPLDYDEEFFRSLMSEERLADGSYKKVYERNEGLDTTVYALAAADIYMDRLIAQQKEWWRKERGSTPEQLKAINRDYIITKLENLGGISG